MWKGRKIERECKLRERKKRRDRERQGACAWKRVCPCWQHVTLYKSVTKAQQGSACVRARACVYSCMCVSKGYKHWSSPARVGTFSKSCRLWVKSSHHVTLDQAAVYTQYVIKSTASYPSYWRRKSEQCFCLILPFGLIVSQAVLSRKDWLPCVPLSPANTQPSHTKGPIHQYAKDSENKWASKNPIQSFHMGLIKVMYIMDAVTKYFFFYTTHFTATTETNRDTNNPLKLFFTYASHHQKSFQNTWVKIQDLI